jgi:hypothetical protein
MMPKKWYWATGFNLLILLVGIFYSYGQQEQGQKPQQKIDVMQFLQKIKDILKEIAERAKQLEKKKKDKAQKKKVRKKILQRLTNPFYWVKRQHWKIEVKKPQDSSKTQPQAAENSSLQQNNQTLQRQINTFLKQNPQLLPFKFPDFKQFWRGNSFKEISNEKEKGLAGDKENGISGKDSSLQTLVKWYNEMANEVIKFWKMFYIYFIKDEKRFVYLRNKVCKGEIDVLKEGFRVFIDMVSVKDEKSGFKNTDIVNIECDDIVSGHCGDVGGTIFAPLAGARNNPKSIDAINNGWFASYYLSNKVVPSCSKAPSVEDSLCSGLANLDAYAVCKISDNDSQILRCLQNMRSCKGIEEVLRLIKKTLKYYYKYFKYASMIYKNQMLPAIFDMCFKKCLCKDLGISRCGENNDSNDMDETAIYILSYQNLKEVEGLGENWYLSVSHVIEVSKKMNSAGYATKETTKCKQIEKDFNRIIQSLFKNLEDNKISVEDIKKSEERFLLAYQENDKESLKENYENLIDGIAKFKEIFSTFGNEITQFFSRYKSNPVCITYFITDFFKEFLNTAVNKNTLELLSQVSLTKLVERLSKEEKERFIPFLLYNILKNTYRGVDSLFSLNVELVDSYKDDSVAVGAKLIEKMVKGKDRSAVKYHSLDFLPLVDYHTYFYFIGYQYAKCVEEKRLIEYVKGDEQKAAFLDCLFGKKDFKVCLEEVYLQQEKLPNVKRVWEEFFKYVAIKNEYVEINNVPLNKIDDILKAFEKIEGKTYIEIFPSVRGCCDTEDICRQAAMISTRDFQSVCSINTLTRKLFQCPPRGQCVLCYKIKDGKEVIECDGSNCRTGNKCERIVAAVNEIFQKRKDIIQLEDFCNRMINYIEECQRKYASVKCGDALSFCESPLKLDVWLAINIRESLPKLPPGELDMIKPADKVVCSE